MYQKLDKEEKEKVRNSFKDTKKGREVLPILNRLLLEGVFSLFCFVVLLIFCIIMKASFFYWLVCILCLLGGIIFLIAQYKIRLTHLNRFVYARKKK